MRSGSHPDAAGAIFAPIETTLAASRVHLRPPIDWQAEFDDAEDRFSLHRFGWALRHVTRHPALESARLVDAVVHDWIFRAPRALEVGWDSYSISERVANWIDCYSILRRFEIAADEHVAASIVEQAEMLSARLEWYGDDLTNNHLLNNARALYHVAQYAGRPDLRATALTLLRRETSSHFTAEGLLNEGSSHYHALLRSRYEGVLAHAERSGDTECAEFIRPWVARLDAAEQRFFAGGRVLVGDLSPDSPPQPRHSPATAIEFVHDAEGGCARLRGGPVDIFLRVPQKAPRARAHEHSDLASFELHWRGRPIFVDPGRSTYTASELGRYARSARAHNAVMVNGLEPVTLARGIELAAFGPEYLKTGVTVERQRTPPGVRIEHDGYRRWRESVHVARSIGIEDRTVRIEDRVMGHGDASIELFLHLHPDVSCRAVGMELELREGPLVLAIATDGSRTERSIVRQEKGPQAAGWYFPRYGVETPATTIVFRWSGPLPFAQTLQVQELSA